MMASSNAAAWLPPPYKRLQIVRKMGVGYDPNAVPQLQRAIWNGPPERLSDAFRLTKQKSDSTLTAVCEV